ncbi:MAG: peptide chain release factor-like protein [Candidatus Margulisiibacteriota bacterium]
MTYVTPQKMAELENRLRARGIRKADVIEKFLRSSGAGGQNVNKVSSAVYLKHLPTGLEVKMQQERSQAVNRFLAWRLLLEKIEERILHKKSQRRQAIEKIRRQKRKRSRRAKEKMLGEKKQRSALKQQRKVSPHEID